MKARAIATLQPTELLPEVSATAIAAGKLLLSKCLRPSVGALQGENQSRN